MKITNSNTPQYDQDVTLPEFLHDELAGIKAYQLIPADREWIDNLLNAFAKAKQIDKHWLDKMIGGIKEDEIDEILDEIFFQQRMSRTINKILEAEEQEQADQTADDDDCEDADDNDDDDNDDDDDATQW